MQNVIDLMKKTLPKYNTIQPSTGKNVSFRPFTVREEKVLLMANTTGNYEDFLRTLADVIDSCFDLKTPALKLPLFDIEYFFIKLRSKSVSEIVEPRVICPVTNKEIDVTLNLDTIEPTYSSNHSKEIKLSPSIILRMKYPTLENLITNNGKNYDYYDLILECIEQIETNDEVVEAKNSSIESIKEFVDLLTKEQFVKIIDFFKTMPQIQTDVKYSIDNEERTLTLKGMQDFFR